MLWDHTVLPANYHPAAVTFRVFIPAAAIETGTRFSNHGDALRLSFGATLYCVYVCCMFLINTLTFTDEVKFFVYISAWFYYWEVMCNELTAFET